ncbi:ribonuclease R [Pelagibacterium sp. 26DY04]|uniref:ribonuclease R n=1 Tax=Pelagibacterium sp. 26DY04 TaxID=2967130 RepID=UPI002815FDBC|nr:ribonuclease R [Pelagibacterium sp. 26DY04]WMT85354.1 ribonuclease R [Pelagibacterium sp. 26DY04]
MAKRTATQPQAPAPRKGRRSANFTPGELPTREAILEAIADFPEINSKREIARHFNIKGDDRIALKVLLRDMEKEGLLARKRKEIRPVGELPAVTVLDIPADADPDNLHAFPAKWDDEEGEKPRVTVTVGKDARVAPAPGDRILARIHREGGVVPVYSARPMKVLDKPRKADLGIVRMDDDGARLVPIERKAREMRIPAGDLGGAKDGDLVEIEVTVSGRLMIPRAKVVNVVGNPQSEGAVSLIALHSLDIPYRFPASVLKAAQQAEEATLKGREDWRDIPLITIDPADAKDHDDAVHAEPDTDPNNPGGFIIHVGIADVSYYVRAGSDMDREAFLRGNSVYFPDRVVPMLPERISNDLCSLREGENRASMALRIVIDAEGNKKRHSFHRVMMRSAAKLSYSQAQAAIDGNPDDATGPLLEPILKPLWAAYAALAKARDRRGPLALDLPERRIRLDENGMVKDVYVPDRLEAHKLIEEMMILSNVCAAETLEKHKVPLLYRVHDAPSREKIVALGEFLKSLDLPVPRSEALRPKDFNQILFRAEKADKSQQVSEMVLRSQAQAEYAPGNYGHYGLNLDRYAHFTSPIRRYSDLIVHRALIKALDLGEDGLTEAEEHRLGAIGEHISATERRAMAAERETSDRLLAQYLAAHIGARFRGTISGLVGAGLFVRLDETGADGFVPVSSLGQDYFRFFEDQQALIGERTGERFRIGDKVDVRLLEAAPMAGALRFEVLSQGERVKPPGPTRGRRTGKGKPAPRGRRARK